MKKFLFAFAFICVLLSCATAFSGVVDKVIAVVNDEVITQREFDKAFSPMKQGIEGNFQGEEREQRLDIVRKQLLEQMINTKLIVSLAKAEKAEVDEDALSERIGRIKAYYNS